MSEQAFSRLIAPVMRRLRLMIGRAVITMVNDSLKEQNLQVTSLDDEPLDDVERPQNYGQFSVPLAGAEAIVLSLGGDTDSAVAVVVEDRRYRPTGLVAGDSGIYHYEGHRIRLTKDGRAIVTCKTLEVYADERGLFDMPVARFTGDIEVDKNLLVKGKAESKGIFTAPDAILGGKSTVKHTHDEHGDGGGTTGPMK
ncbi:phage baseplate assembly protein V [Citrobacter freundii]|uniref:phage baseplate assembly protein V n=1 Tax=Enterobacteriaceae TaxID=543 RepID=UPI00053898D8|nr:MULTISPECIES: phage baseplate assembly protein V [Enterobacteriaceae]HAT1573036.1 phage baseplate assembly protein V [Kluyvera cryocrescens]ATX97225.1 phage baseplate assembly protein V [Citrobacter freundii]AUU27438.1 phage baseplate assembly protein V [Citrobacter freundii]EJR7284423.1 phage baseplate assembly protein V [Citrobacter freundii]EKT9243975.1 phage baseplate assembly protein V [Citrobacter freundii]